MNRMAIMLCSFWMAGCQLFSPWQEKPLTTIIATMKAQLKQEGAYELTIQKIILCDGQDYYTAMGQISYQGSAPKVQNLEDKVSFLGPMKPIHYFLVIHPANQKEVIEALEKHPYQVVDSEDSLLPTASKISIGGDVKTQNISNCQIYFIRQ